MGKKQKFGGYGEYISPAFSSLSEEKPAFSLKEMIEEATDYLRDQASSIKRPWDGIPGEVLAMTPWHKMPWLKPFTPIMCSRYWKLTTYQDHFTVPHEANAAVLDALEVLSFIDMFGSTKQMNEKEAIRFGFKLGCAWERFQIRKTGIETLASSQSKSIKNLPKKLPKDPSEAWATACKRFPDGPKQRRVEFVVELGVCSESTLKRWLKKNSDLQ